MYKSESNIVLFDGVCNLCNKTVQFIIRHDPKSKFRFASVQSESGQLLLEQLGLPLASFDSLVYISDNKFYLKSTAVLKIFLNLGNGFQLLYVFRVIPRKLRDIFYDLIAKRRYIWFGKSETCMVPTLENQARFLN